MKMMKSPKPKFSFSSVQPKRNVNMRASFLDTFRISPSTVNTRFYSTSSKENPPKVDFRKFDEFKEIRTFKTMKFLELEKEQERITNEEQEQAALISGSNQRLILMAALKASTALTPIRRFEDIDDKESGLDVEDEPQDIESLLQGYLDDVGLQWDETAAFGVAPKSGSPWDGKIDVTDVRTMLANRALREEYLEIDRQIEEAANEQISGIPKESSDTERENALKKIAETVVEMRNTAKEKIRKKGTPESEEKLAARNIKLYGHPLGPTAQSLFDKYENWETVIQKSYAPNVALNTLFGLSYDQKVD